MRHPLLTALGLFLPLTAMSCPGEVSYTGANTSIKSTGGSAELDVIDVPGGCHNWHAQGSITLMDVSVQCSFDPKTGSFTKNLSVKSADPLQEMIEANKNQQAISAQLLQALTAAVGALMPKPVP